VKKASFDTIRPCYDANLPLLSYCRFCPASSHQCILLGKRQSQILVKRKRKHKQLTKSQSVTKSESIIKSEYIFKCVLYTCTYTNVGKIIYANSSSYATATGLFGSRSRARSRSTGRIYLWGGGSGCYYILLHLSVLFWSIG
jgi:hypothetical protein